MKYTYLNVIVVASVGASFFLTAAHASNTNKHEINKYEQTNFVSNNLVDKPTVNAEANFINAWGIAIRPKGAGGHFWVTAKNISYQYVGDVKDSPDEKLRTLHQDDLKIVKLPVGGRKNFATSVVFSDSKENFAVSHEIEGAETIIAPAKFIFASDGGVISAWTERKRSDGGFDRPQEAVKVIDLSDEGKQYFGLAISKNYDILYAANFGSKPGIDMFDGRFKRLTSTFSNPFDENDNGKIDGGEYAPFNVQRLDTPYAGSRIFVTYAKTQKCPKSEIEKKTCKKNEPYPGEEDSSTAGYGRLAEFTEEGKLVRVWKDDGKLNAPWGIAFAPSNFGAVSGMLLVGNFGSGEIVAYDPETTSFKNYLRSKKTTPLKIDKLWGLLFGNGESLGDSDSLYFAAGPDDEKDGLFGKIRLFLGNPDEE